MHHKTLNRNLMPIGRFSKSCRLSIKALRHYDDVGLLKPVYEQRDSMREIYLNDPANTARDDLLTDVILPIKSNSVLEI